MTQSCMDPNVMEAKVVVSSCGHNGPFGTIGVQRLKELQTWWEKIRTVNPADKKDEPWWPILKSPKDLVDIVITIVWIASGHHAAMNFKQYDYAGYFQSRPTTANSFAFFGFCAPSLFPTLLDTLKPKDDGNMYCKEVV